MTTSSLPRSVLKVQAALAIIGFKLPIVPQAYTTANATAFLLPRNEDTTPFIDADDEGDAPAKFYDQHANEITSGDFKALLLTAFPNGQADIDAAFKPVSPLKAILELASARQKFDDLETQMAADGSASEHALVMAEETYLKLLRSFVASQAHDLA